MGALATGGMWRWWLARITAVASYKGGTGKTTTALNLATFLSNAGQRVLVVDLDASAGASLALGMVSRGAVPPVFAALQQLEGAISHVQPSTWGFDVLASGSGLAQLPDWARSRVGGEFALAELFEQPSFQRYDAVLLDCPATIGLTTRMALVAAHDVLVPIDCKSDGAVHDLVQLFEDVVAVKQRLNPPLAVWCVLPCRLDRTKLCHHIFSALLQHDIFGRYVLHDEAGAVRIRDNASIADAKFDRQPLSAYAPNSYGALDYQRLTNAYLEATRD